MEFYKPRVHKKKKKSKHLPNCTKLEMNDFSFDFVLMYSFFDYNKPNLNISARGEALKRGVASFA